ncbi:MAG TPA: Bd3614 family nucleic acid deaminase [Planctomycetota bacterium]|nr:Bd3614 family nucleic acid deaminase [Planctomycetota bacterium]
MLSWVTHNDEVFFARGADATTTLIQGIYETRPRDAHFILRHTIFTTVEPTAFALGMVRVAAKKLKVVPPHPDPPPLRGGGRSQREITYAHEPPPRIETSPKASHEEWLRFALSLVPATPDGLPRHARDRRVGAALVAPDGTLLAASANTNGANRTRHAELNVLLAHRSLAPGTRLYVTLRPCKMCAGLLWDRSRERGTVLVFYAEDDPGPAARNTVLCPGSDMRKLFARTSAELEAPGCEHVPLVS